MEQLARHRPVLLLVPSPSVVNSVLLRRRRPTWTVLITTVQDNVNKSRAPVREKCVCPSKDP